MHIRSGTALLLLLGSAAACGGDPTGAGDPPDLTCANATVPLCTDVAYAAAVRTAIADAGGRIAPALSAEAESAVAGDLAELQAALDAGNVTDARAAAESLRDALAALRAVASAADLPSLDAIALAVIQAELALGVAPAALPSSRLDAPA